MSANITVRLPSNQAETLRRKAKTTDITQADMLRLAIDDLLKMTGAALVDRYIRWRQEKANSENVPPGQQVALNPTQ
jgi:hypothetical protein